MLENLTSGDFRRFINEVFGVTLDADQRLELRLVDVRDLGRPQGSRFARLQPFSLLFRGPGEIYLPQRIYTLEHGVMGTLEIFLVPIGIDDEGYQYEAIFN